VPTKKKAAPKATAPTARKAPVKKVVPVTKAAAAKPVTKKKAAPAVKKTAASKPPQLEVCHITFPFCISGGELAAFRGAVIAGVQKNKAAFTKAGIATDLFHNHDEQEAGRRHLRPPAVVYQLVRPGNAAGLPADFFFPCVAGFGAGAAAVRLLGTCLPAVMQLHRRAFATSGFALAQSSHAVRPGSRLHEYKLRQWLALNPDNHTRYQNELRFTQRVALLEAVLHKNIAGWYAARQLPLEAETLRVYITEITGIAHGGAELNGRNMFAFDCSFAVNLDLPPQMAVGNGATWGFGQMKPLPAGAARQAALQRLLH
jgi:hypothetical protein